MATKSTDIHKLDEIDYGIKIHTFIFVLLLGIFFTFSFLTYFPIDDKIKFFVKNNVLKNISCPIDFGNFRTELFVFPKIIVTNVIIPASCFDTTGESIKLPEARLKFMGPNFSPIGLAFKLETNVEGQELEINFGTGLSTQKINFQEEELVLQRFQNLPILPFKMQGKTRIEFVASRTAGKISDLTINMQSKDFVLPAQIINEIKLTSLVLKEFVLDAHTPSPGKLVVKNFFIGDLNSPIRLKMSGTVNLKESFTNSPINLTGGVKFSDKFLESYGIIKMMMSPYTQKDGFYQIKLQGTVGNPVPAPL